MTIKQLFHTKLLDLEEGSYDIFYQEKRYLLYILGLLTYILYFIFLNPITFSFS